MGGFGELLLFMALIGSFPFLEKIGGKLARGFFRGSLVQLASSGEIQKLSKNRRNKKIWRQFLIKKNQIFPVIFTLKKYLKNIEVFPTKKR